MGQERQAIAELRRALGERLATYRKLAELSQAQLGERLYSDRTTIVRLEQGNRSKDVRFWQRADDLLGADGALVAAFSAVEAARADHERREREAEVAAHRRKIESWRRNVQPLSTSEAPSPETVPAPPPGLLPAPSSRATPADLAAIEAMADAFRLADRRVGGGKLYRSVLSYLRDEVSPHLFDPAGDQFGVDLFAAAASLTEIAGWMAHDGGNDQRARQHFGQAYRLAATVNHTALAANVCASMSHLAGQLGEPREAVRIAEVGLRHAARSQARQRQTARLLVLRARGHAMQDQARDCLLALRQAEQALGRVRGDEPVQWISPFEEGALASEAALCLRRLGKLSDAERHARRVLTVRVGDRVRSRAFGQITLARILPDAGQVDEAGALGMKACTVAMSLTSARVLARLRELNEALQPYASVPEVRDFLTHFADLESRQGLHNEDTTWPV